MFKGSLLSSVWLEAVILCYKKGVGHCDWQLPAASDWKGSTLCHPNTTQISLLGNFTTTEQEVALVTGYVGFVFEHSEEVKAKATRWKAVRLL